MSERDANESLHSMVSAEHRKLEVIFEELRDALRPGGSGPSAAGIFQEMRKEVETHFEVEWLDADERRPFDLVVTGSELDRVSRCVVRPAD